MQTGKADKQKQWSCKEELGPALILTIIPRHPRGPDTEGLVRAGRQER